MSKKGDMLYAWTNDAEIQKKAELGGAVTTLWKYALESKMVDAVLVVTKGVDLYDAKPVLITDAKDLANTAGSLHCGTLLLPKLIKKFYSGAKDMKIGVPRQHHHDRCQLRRLGQPGHCPEDDQG